MLRDGRATVQAQKAPEPVPAATAAASPDPGSRTIRVDAIVTDKHGAPIARTPPARLHGSRERRRSRRSIESSGVRIRHRRSARSLRQAKSRTMRTNAAPPRSPARGSSRSISTSTTSARDRDTERVRVAVSRFIDEQIRPGDLLVVMKPLDHLTEIRFTRDRDAARQSVSSFTGRRNDYTPREHVRGAVSREVASCGACRAGADRDVGVEGARHEDGRTGRRPRRHRADERGVHDRRAARARAAAARSARDSCAPRAVFACCSTPSIPGTPPRLSPGRD